LDRLEKYGKFNAGMISFKNDGVGRLCLEWWQKKCTEWCFDRLDGNRFADQKYLDEIPIRFNSVYICKHLGINSAPWNILDSSIFEISGEKYIKDSKLICYHFHGVSRIFKAYFDTGYTTYASLSNNLKNSLYKPYLNKIISIEHKLHEEGVNCIIGDRRDLKVIKVSEPSSIINLTGTLRAMTKYARSFLKNGIVKASKNYKMKF
jgi:hypothetical protein